LNNEELVDDYYKNYYRRVHSSGTLGSAHRKMHSILESGRGNTKFPVTLEIGAGNLEHYPFVLHERDEFIATDIRECGLSPCLPESWGAEQGSFVFIQADAMKLPFPDNYADRIVAGCVLMHLPDPSLAVKEWQRVCKPSGVIDLLVPCDPGLLTRIFRRVISEHAARKMGIPIETYRTVNAIEHINHFNRALVLTKISIEPGRKFQVRYYPFKWIHSWNLNAFAVFSINPAMREGKP